MAARKTFFLLFLLCAVSLISAKVTAEQTREKNDKKIEESKGYCRYGCCWKGYHGKCKKCCSTPAEVPVLSEGNVKPAEQKEVKEMKGYCKYGCCWKGYHGKCKKCCQTPEEAQIVDADQTEAAGTNKKEGEESKAYCRYGCCWKGNHGKCKKCCSSSHEKPQN